MSEPIQPFIFEPPPPPKDERSIPGPNDFELYDEDFSLEHDERYTELSDSATELRRPHFTVSETARMVFGKNLDWIKVRLRRPFTLNGEELEFRRVGRRWGNNGAHERRLTLPDIERLAWAMYERGNIDGERLQNAHIIVTTMARQHGVTPRGQR